MGKFGLPSRGNATSLAPGAKSGCLKHKFGRNDSHSLNRSAHVFVIVEDRKAASRSESCDQFLSNRKIVVVCLLHPPPHSAFRAVRNWQSHRLVLCMCLFHCRRRLVVALALICTSFEPLANTQGSAICYRGRGLYPDFHFHAVLVFRRSEVYYQEDFVTY